MNRFLQITLTAVALTALSRPATADVIDFEDLSVPALGYENGAHLNPPGGFICGGAFFNNSYEATFDSWTGWSYSNRTGSLPPPPTPPVPDSPDYPLGKDFAYLYHAAPGSGAEASANYGVAYFDTFDPSGKSVTITLPTGFSVVSAQITNTMYTVLSMRDGDAFADPFGPKNFLKLTITGLDNSNQSVGSVDFTLGSGRSFVQDWTNVDLSSLSAAHTLVFTMDSNDTNDFGIATPTTFALDNLVIHSSLVPEPASLALLGLGGVLARLALRKRRNVTHRA